MADTYLGIDGGIGRLRNPDYSAKAPTPDSKLYVKTFGRMAIDGTMVRNPRSYAGKIEVIPNLNGGVQSEPATVSGAITRTALQTISGAVTAENATVSGAINAFAFLSGAVQSGVGSVTGTVTTYPLTGWSLTDFTVNFAGLSANSPFSGDPAYTNLAIGDKCHYETLTAPDSHTMTMAGNGEFTIVPSVLTQNQTFDIQIYDLSDGTFGATATITVTPGVADVSLSGAVQSLVATVSGSLTSFTVHTMSGAVQSEQASVNGVINEANIQVVVGGVQAESPTVSGVLERIIKMSGSVQAEASTVTGTFSKVVKMNGGVQAQRATVVGNISPPTETPAAIDPRTLEPGETNTGKFINRTVKWKSTRRRANRR